jgi:hypothetical protein
MGCRWGVAGVLEYVDVKTEWGGCVVDSGGGSSPGAGGMGSGVAGAGCRHTNTMK